ncbi:MAG: methylated-DNA--[protein]-cysteine S-methyltransferase [Bacteroidetes bacterium]|nr:methylated-DNA--[protein]-cysteine S-methyltransferase [Bacteroidota bacterium]
MAKRPASVPELFGPMYVASLESPIGKVYVECDGERITRVSFRNPGRGRGGKAPKALKEAVIQLEAYFAGRRRKFDLPLYEVGSAYRRNLWERLKKVPFGKALTYEQLADSVGGNARSAGSACGDNTLLLVVPCHRVLGKNGLLTGYAGELWRKKWLLEHEGVLPKEAA